MNYLAIIPAYNEGANIYNVIKNIKNSNSEFDIMVILNKAFGLILILAGAGLIVSK